MIDAGGEAFVTEKKTDCKYGDITEHKYLFHQGRDYRSYEFLGARPAGTKKSDGTLFRVWAPRAQAVSLVGDFNDWDPARDPMYRLADDDSVWEIISRDIHDGDLYKYAIIGCDGRLRYKADPYAFYSESARIEEGSQRASRVWNIGKRYRWGDSRWIKNREKKNPYTAPMNIYEVHLGSWKHGAEGELGYRELAEALIPYVKKMGYTHIELLPVMEHPFDGSWGYQVTGYYSVTSRYGTPEDFKYLVDQAHRNGIGVILDWVPAHFPKDEHGLVEFDGAPLFEYSDPFKMEHKGWGTRSFDFSRPEVLSFLISNAFFYCEQFHADGLRVDAVAAMLYLDYEREGDEWRPNEKGGKENLEVISFLQQLNRDVLTNFPGVLMIAEESTAWPDVTKPPETGGLGFNFKWNMGWMNDVLQYISTDPVFRSGIHHNLTFATSYAYSENYILPVSHDEVVHGKCSLLSKMPGEYEDKFAGLRSFLVYMFTHPGKKLTFMGAEFGQFIEWDEKRELDWMLLDYPLHRKTKDFCAALNQLYLSAPALWACDDRPEGFEWIDADNMNANVYTYCRHGDGEDPQTLLVILNLSGRDFEEFDIGVPQADFYQCILDTDRRAFGGTGSRRKKKYKVKKGEVNGRPGHITCALPKLSAMILERGVK